MKGWTFPTSNRYGSNRRASVNSVGCAHPASRGWSSVADRPLRDASHWSVRVDAEDVGKSLAALVGEVDGAAALGTPDPAEIEQAVGQRRGDGGATPASASRRSATSGPASRK